MNKKDDNVVEDSDFSDLEKKMNEADFSVGHKESVWKKIISKLQTPNDEDMSMEELDMVAGGMHKPPTENSKPPKGGN